MNRIVRVRVDVSGSPVWLDVLAYSATGQAWLVGEETKERPSKSTTRKRARTLKWKVVTDLREVEYE